MKLSLRLRSRLRLLRILQYNGLRSHFIAKKAATDEACVCKNCGTHFQGRFCPQCGQSSKTRRLSFLNMIEDGLSLITNLDSGILRTVTELYWRPGHMIRDYIQGHRKGYMKPLSLLFCLSTIYYIFVWLVSKDALSFESLNSDDIQLAPELEEYTPLVGILKDYLEQWLSNPGLVILTIILNMVPAAWLCFRHTHLGKQLNFMEHFHVQLFIASQMMLLVIFLTVLHFITRGYVEYMDFDFELCLLLYVWDFKQLFNIRWLRSIKLTFVSLLLVPLVIILICLVAVGIGVLIWYCRN